MQEISKRSVNNRNLLIVKKAKNKGMQKIQAGNCKYSLLIIPPVNAMKRYRNGYLKFKFTPTYNMTIGIFR